jgi:hypothetical protein
MEWVVGGGSGSVGVSVLFVTMVKAPGQHPRALTLILSRVCMALWEKRGETGKMMPMAEMERCHLSAFFSICPVTRLLVGCLETLFFSFIGMNTRRCSTVDGHPLVACWLASHVSCRPKRG